MKILYHVASLPSRISDLKMKEGCIAALSISRSGLLARHVELVELSAIGKMHLLRVLPVAEEVLELEQLHRRKLFGIFCGHLGIGGTVVVLAGDVLPFRRVERYCR